MIRKRIESALRRRTRLAVFLFFLIGTSIVFFSGCVPAEGIEAIKKAGVLKVGIKDDVPGLGLYNSSTKSYEGLEVELAKLFAKEILGDSSKVKFTVITPINRGEFLNKNKLDMVIATFTITEERKLMYYFSPPYYTDAVGMLVKNTANYTGIRDMNGKTIGVPFSATAWDSIDNAAAKAGITPIIVEYKSYAELKSALNTGKIDVFAVDKSILKGYLDSNTRLLSEELSPQPYGVSTKRTNRELSSFVDECITRWLADGTIANLIRLYNL